MTNSEIRLENARWLAAKCGGGARFADKLGLSDSRVSQMIGKTPTKNIGSSTARKIEAAFDRPSGWLDIPNAWAQEESQHIVRSTPVSAEDIARLVILFGDSTEDGRRQIMRMAESSEKSTPKN